MNSNPWLLKLSQNEDAPKRIFCFHPAGSAANFYAKWAPHFPAEFQVIAIQMPGRWERSGEPVLKSVSDIVAALDKFIGSELDRPYVALGFSLGSLISFEWIRHLRKAGQKLPEHFVTLSKSAPRLITNASTLHKLPDIEFLQIVNKVYGGIPAAVFEDPELQELFLPSLRGDLEAYETYRFVEEEPLPIAITAVGGTSDLRVSLEQLQGWREQTSVGFSCKQFQGGHFFNTGHELEIVKYISGEISLSSQ